MRIVTLTLGLLAYSLTSLAANLGSLSLVSRIGEPFDARLVVRDVKQGEPVEVALGDASYYERIGKKAAPEVTSFRILQELDNKGRLRIVSDEPLKLESFPLILVLKSEEKLQAKVYNVKLAAPRSVKKNEPKPAAVTVEHKEKVSEPIKSAKAPEVKKPETKAALTKVPTAQVKKPEAKVAKSPAPEVKKVTKPVNAIEHAPIRVKKGMTTWSIAKSVRGDFPGASIERIIVAFVRANPKAFTNGMISGLRRGARLNVPTPDEVYGISEEEARAIVNHKPAISALKPLVSEAKKAPEKASPAEPQEPADPTFNKALVRSQTAPLATPKEEKASEPVAEKTTPEAEAKAPESSTVEKTEVPENKSASVETTVSKKATSTKKPVSKKMLAIGAGVLALFVAALFFWRRASRKNTKKPETKATETPVVFHDKPIQMESAQIEAIEKTVTQRMESDSYAERGFELKGEKFDAPAPAEISPMQASSEEPVIPQEEVKEQKENVAATEPAPFEVTEEPAQTSDARIEPTLGINLGNVSSEEKPQEEASFNEVPPVAPVTPNEAIPDVAFEQKLTEVKELLKDSLSEKALEILEEIALKGDEKQRAAALRLLTLRDQK